MEERKACALLKGKFEAAGFHIAENVMFEEADLRFEIDGWDAAARVGYEYVTEEMGDSWDVDADVRAKLDARRAKGELAVLVVEETAAPDEPALGKLADAFLASLEAKPAAAKKKSPPPVPKKPAAAKKKSAKK